MLPVHGADAPGHGAVLGDGVLQQVAHHHVLVHVPVRVGAQVVVDELIGLGAVVVVGVDDGEGSVHQLPGGQGGLGGAPGLGALWRHGVARGQVVLTLEGVLHVHHLRHPVADAGAEIGLDLLLDDEDHGFEPGPAGVVDGVVDDELSVVSHGVQLLEAAVPAAHAGGHDH